MKAIKNRLNKLNKLAVVDEVDTVFLTKEISFSHGEAFEARANIEKTKKAKTLSVSANSSHKDYYIIQEAET
ncbi:hypothetical protein [Streptococcus pneumoniae]|uniref:hypothetical protein n=1 Tax=Streptococcus pneumoniae TaxID=1313 RepID=UPI00076980BF|nr:hypothetical protein [Streptococcus pneumoniae]CYH25712.1 Uncharacterised protein [Streptococcus pneumoniae]